MIQVATIMKMTAAIMIWCSLRTTVIRMIKSGELQTYLFTTKKALTFIRSSRPVWYSQNAAAIVRRAAIN